MSNSSRTDSFVFYACAASSFLESRVATYVENLEPFPFDAETCRWLRATWLPEEAEHGRLMRRYVQDVWPEFEWERGYAEFSRLYLPQCAHEKLRPSVALEALARCVTETQATMIYRCIGSHTQDPELRALMRRMSGDEVRHYRYFKDLHLRHERLESNGWLRKTKILLARSELVRDEDLALAFGPLNAAWRTPPPFVRRSYEEFLRDAGNVLRAHFPFEEAQRMLFSPLRRGALTDKWAARILGALVSRQFLTFARP